MLIRPLHVGFISLLSLSFVFAQEMTGGAMTGGEMTGGDMTGGSVGAATVQVGEDEELGQFLVDAEGMTLYLFTNDTENTSNCDEDCIQNWPPLLTEGEPTAGEGADAALLGTTERADGDTQVTYNGWPLYYFVNDEAAGDTTGQAAGEVWYVVSPQGEAVQAE
jgi:predicted lipoprotein with Yx(FWY)xxD motif